jgi:hypothetical protein
MRLIAARGFRRSGARISQELISDREADVVNGAGIGERRRVLDADQS